MKHILATVGVVMTAVTLGAAEAESENSEINEETEKSWEAGSDSFFAKLQLFQPLLSGWEAGFDFDFFSAYVWRNAVQNDEMVMQPCVWADWTFADPFYVGFSIWQNYDITGRRSEVLSHGLTETDYNVHIGATIWQSEDADTSLVNEDADTSLVLEIGHEWYDNEFVRNGEGGGYPDTRELYAKVTFENPFVNVYGQTSWMYEDFGDYQRGFHYELGFNREFELNEYLSEDIKSLVFGIDWNLNFGDGRYLSYLYGNTYSGVDENGEAVYGDTSCGFGGTTVKLYLTWQVTDCFSLGATLAYTGILNASYRESIRDQGGDFFYEGSNYPRDFVWGGFSAKLSF